MDKNIKDIIFLLANAVNNKQVSSKFYKEINQQDCLKIAHRHNLIPAIYIALKDIIDVKNTAWERSYYECVRRNMIFDQERQKIFNFMDQNNIWHMPMKGIILQNLYPNYGMREMVDNDILYDDAYTKTLRKYMDDNNYNVVKGIKHDSYMKPPIFNFEMHKTLYNDDASKKVFDYFNKLDKRLHGSGNLKNLSSEDYYIFHIAHMHHHDNIIGIGIRQVLDIYVCLNYLNINLDYVEKICKKLDIADYEMEHRKLAKELFSKPSTSLQISDKQFNRTLELFESTTTGTKEQHIKNKLQNIRNTPKGFRLYFFPSLENLQKRGRQYAKYKALLPIYWIRNDFQILKTFVKGSYFSAFINYLRKNKSNKH